MNTLNYLYPFGEGHDSYLEYQLCCKRCGKIMHLFLPNELTHTGYCNGGNSCHDFGYSINRGTQTLFADNVIKVYEKTGQEGWDKLDGALLDTTLKDDAISLLQRFGVGCQHTVQHMKQEAVNLLAIDASNNGFF